MFYYPNGLIGRWQYLHESLVPRAKVVYDSVNYELKKN